MHELLSDAELMSLLRRALELIAKHELEALTEIMREDAMISSPFSEHHEGSQHRLHGRDEIREYFGSIKNHFDGFRVQDVFSDGLIFKVLLSDGGRRMIIVIELDDSTATIKRFIICSSLLSRFTIELGS